MASQKFGRYLIKSELGRGGMATVFQAYDPRFRRDVALKVLPREFLHDPTFRARFKREARTIALLEHPAIVPVYDFGEEEGQPYLVMRFLPGGTLTQRVKQGALALTEAIRLVNSLAPALDEAHRQGIIHRDLKPDNILFDQHDNPFITDFGIVKLSESRTPLTTGNAIVGTPAYMSPEQARGEAAIDGRSDIYALGVILFEMLTGKLPYQADTPIGLIMMHLNAPVPHILEVRADLPPGCEAVVAQAMAKKRDQRYATTQALATALAESINAEPTNRPSPPPIVPPAPRPESLQAGPTLSGPAKDKTIICPKCQTANPEHLQVCLNCGQRLKIVCPLCHTPNRLDASHCDHCGANMKLTRFRRRELHQARQRTLDERDHIFKKKEARQARERVKSLLHDLGDRKKRSGAIQQLNQMGERTLEALTGTLLDDRDPEGRYSSINVLGQMSDERELKALIKTRIAQALIKALDDPDPQVRYRAAEALGKFKGQAGQLAVEPLAALLKDPDEAVRKQAQRSLEKIGGKQAQAFLDKAKGFLNWFKGS